MEKKELLLIIEKAKKGDEQAISLLYSSHITDIYRFIFYKVGNTHDAEDITQETLMAAFSGLAKFRGDASFRNWCYEIAKRKIADLWRARYKMPIEDIEETLKIDPQQQYATDSDLLQANEERKTELVHTILDSLQERYRTILEYRFLKNYTIKETAQAMHISVSNAKVLQHRALKKASLLHPELPQHKPPTTESNV